MISFPNAKINLGLNIIEKRPDGFHNLESCFYPIGWSDILEILPADTLQFQSTGIGIPEDGQDNLCLRAYHLLKKDFDISPVHIHLHKVVPIGAGLGGGSADAAFTIKSLNELFKLDLDIDTMQNYARQLGSDCAFFIENTPKYCFDKGDRFDNIALNLKDKFLVLVYPATHVSTGEAYAGIVPTPSAITIQDIFQKDIAEWKNLLKNDFEPQIFAKYPAVAQIKAQLYEQGALYASMTGSGSTLFGIFDAPVELSFPENYSTFSQMLPL
ncbi:MAG TPA: 4-(cytidine 5'-diphospho)-2-C-methyl-D-erythritol kinase [Microscillaceae bacterium]|nr:4-(cytidine 5'-diphospho)-2-C-methyl-D-erythritol kinase [Microscillaceae bacterium]